MSTLTEILIYLLVVVILVGLAIRFGRISLERMKGYRFGRDVIVKCRAGHLYMTTWLPMGSVKALRFGLVRIQYCPVGDHVTAVRIMRDEDLTAAQRLEARRHRDSGVP